MRRFTGVLTVALMLAIIPTGADATSPPIAGCAYGSDVPALSGYEQTAVQQAAGAYSGDRAAFAAAAAAYIYGQPLEQLIQTVNGYVHNTLVNVDALATPTTKGVVSPNVDTAYSVAWIDLTDGPLVFSVPAAPSRFYTVQFMDAYTNAFAYVGYGSTGTAAGSYAIVPPGWSGTLPSGVTRIQSPTNVVWLLGRTLTDGTAADLAQVKTVQAQYRLTPLSAYEVGVREGGVSLGAYPAGKSKTLPSGTAFIGRLNQELTVNPPPAADDCALSALAPAGVQVPDPTASQESAAEAENIAGTTPTPQLSDAATAAVSAGITAAQLIVAKGAAALEASASAGRSGWTVLASGIGTYGTDYLSRAIIGTNFLGANTPIQGVYPLDYTDVDGRTLDGDSNDTITFPRGHRPPAGAFWSLTVYGADNFLYANAIGRYAVGNRTAGLQYNADGSLTIRLQNAQPSGNAQDDWLPVPKAAYHVILRLYQPAASVLNGSWTPPPIFAAGETLTPALSHVSVRTGRLRYDATQATRVRITLIGPQGIRQVAHADTVGTNTVSLGRLSAGRYRVYIRALRALYDTGSSPRASVRFRVR